VSIEKVSEIRDLWRAIFQLNADGGKDRYKIQARIDAAFLTLWELKTITEHLRDCEAARESHLDSEGVNFHIGQVVQPKDYKWRGVIAGWGKTEESLHQGGTTKSSIHYTLLQDSGDSILMGKQNKNQVPIYKMSKDGLNKYQMLMVDQSDFRLLDDTLLCRVRNKDYSAFFYGYDAFKNCFKPNDSTKYDYRMEDIKSKEWNGAMYSSKSTETSNAAKHVIKAVQSLATRFENRIQETECVNTFLGSSSILNDLQESLFRLSRGDALCDSERLKKDVTVEYVASLHLKELRKCSLLVSKLFSQCRSALESRNGIQFQLGDVAQHKLYGF
jgi:Hemimethylated DNA-binding protein YccV like